METIVSIMIGMILGSVLTGSVLLLYRQQKQILDEKPKKLIDKFREHKLKTGKIIFTGSSKHVPKVNDETKAWLIEKKIKQPSIND